MKRFKIIKLPKRKLPSNIILNQLKQCQRKGGLIFSTYKALVSNKETLNTDIVFENINDFGGYYIIDKYKKDEIVSWCIFINGKINNKQGIQTMYFTRPFYRGLGLGTMLFDKIVKYTLVNNLIIWVYPYNDNKWFFRKLKNNFKNIKIENIYKA